MVKLLEIRRLIYPAEELHPIGNHPAVLVRNNSHKKNGPPSEYPMESNLSVLY